MLIDPQTGRLPSYVRPIIGQARILSTGVTLRTAAALIITPRIWAGRLSSMQCWEGKETRKAAKCGEPQHEGTVLGEHISSNSARLGILVGSTDN